MQESGWFLTEDRWCASALGKALTPGSGSSDRPSRGPHSQPRARPHSARCRQVGCALRQPRGPTTLKETLRLEALVPPDAFLPGDLHA